MDFMDNQMEKNESARLAAEILNNPLFERTLESIREDIIADWIGSPADEAKSREKL
jgi:hypothetical protein